MVVSLAKIIEVKWRKIFGSRDDFVMSLHGLRAAARSVLFSPSITMGPSGWGFAHGRIEKKKKNSHSTVDQGPPWLILLDSGL